MRILIIEDDRDAAAYLAKAFREAGHVVDLAHDGVTGYDMAVEGGYDVAIVDRMLPGLDGLSAGRRQLRDRRQHAGAVPVRARQVDDRVRGPARPAATTISPSPTPSPSCWRGSRLWRRRPTAPGVADRLGSPIWSSICCRAR